MGEAGHTAAGTPRQLRVRVPPPAPTTNANPGMAAEHPLGRVSELETQMSKGASCVPRILDNAGTVT